MSENEDAVEVLLFRCEDKLTKWELHFLQSIEDHPDRLSKKQQETLDRIWTRCMG